MYIYLLHFHRPLAHAAHYIGISNRPGDRLRKHATNPDVRILQAVRDAHIEWRLAALYHIQSVERTARQLERHIKNQHCGPDWCPLCSKTPRTPPGVLQIDLSLVPFPLTSMELRNER